LPPALQAERKRPGPIALPVEPKWIIPDFGSFHLPPMTLTLRLITWNVWFQPVDAAMRTASLFSEVLGAAPDVLCLQEVREELAASIRTSAALLRCYAISPNDVSPYGNLLLVRHELSPIFKETPFPSQMGRSLLLAECRPATARDDSSLAVATVHLESLNNAPTRAKQLRIAQSALDRYQRVLLAGDFNFDSSQNFGDWSAVPPRPPRPEREASDDDEANPWAGAPLKRPREGLENDIIGQVLPDYIDMWPTLHAESDGGHTFDGSRNVYVADPEEIMRYDRVLAKGAVPVTITLLGLPEPDHGTLADGLVNHGTSLSEASSQQTPTRATALMAPWPHGPPPMDMPAIPTACPPSDHYGLCAVVTL